MPKDAFLEKTFGKVWLHVVAVKKKKKSSNQVRIADWQLWKSAVCDVTKGTYTSPAAADNTPTKVLVSRKQIFTLGSQMDESGL